VLPPGKGLVTAFGIARTLGVPFEEALAKVPPALAAEVRARLQRVIDSL